MNLIDTYVSEVGRHLPKQARADIEAEIRSILEDMLEERSQKSGKPVDEEMTVEILKEYGAPEKVAASYLPERYVIGPRLYPLFMLVLRIVLTVTGVLAAVGLGIAMYQANLTAQSIFEVTIRTFANFVTTIMVALGNIVLIFAIIEWALRRSGKTIDIKGMPKEKEWDPRSLGRIAPTNQVKMAEVIIEIVGSFAAIAIFNFYPQIIGFGYTTNGSWYVGAGSGTFVPLLSETFFSFVPYLTIVWSLTIILDIILLQMGTWNTITRLGSIGLKVVNIIIASEMLAGPSLLALTAASLTIILGDAEWARNFVIIMNQAIRILLWLSIFGNVVEIIKAISRMITSSQLAFPVPKKS